MLALSIVAAFTFASCNNDSDSDYAKNADYVTVVGSTPITFVTDKGVYLTLADTDPTVGNYNPNYGQRALIYYTPLSNAQGQTTNNIKLYGYYHFTPGDTEVIASDEENNFGNLDADVYFSYNEYFLVHPTKSVLDIALCFYAEKTVEGHDFTLVLNTNEPVSNGFLNLELCHSATESEATGTRPAYNMITFDMSLFAAYIEGTTGVQITTPGINSEEPLIHQFNWAE